MHGDGDVFQWVEPSSHHKNNAYNTGAKYIALASWKGKAFNVQLGI